MWIWKRMSKISCSDYAQTSDEVLELAEEERTLTTTLKQRQKKMVGSWDMRYATSHY